MRTSVAIRAATIVGRGGRGSDDGFDTGSSTSTANKSLSNLVPPYPTDGGHVPIYAMFHGLIQKRNWIFRNPEWCDLCKEPVALWVNHHGRKDHALLDMHYTAMVEYPRRWNPEAFLQEFRAQLGVEAEVYQAHFAQRDQERRSELYVMLATLQEEGMLYFGEPRHTYLNQMQGGFRGMDLQGALVLHEYILGPFMRLYPDGHIQDYSNLVDFVTCSYNMETVYDLCGFYNLDTVALASNFKMSSPAALGLGGIATSSTATGGFEQSGQSTSTVDARKQEDLDEEAFSRKAVFMRQILGQLRWLLLPGQEHPAGFTFPPHAITLGEICVKSLIVEIIVARLCEYIVRVEPTWRSFGYERKRLDMKHIVKEAGDVVPRTVQYTYRRMCPEWTDLFSTEKKSTMEDELKKLLAKKGGPTSD